MGFDHMMAVFNTSFPEGGKVSASTLKAVAMALASRANSETGTCHPSYEDISAHTQLESRSSISNAIEMLELIGFLRKSSRFLAYGGRTSNEYLIRNTCKVPYLSASRRIQRAEAFVGWHYGPEDEWVGPEKVNARPPWSVVWRPRLIHVNDYDEDEDFAMFCPSDMERWIAELKKEPAKIHFTGPDGNDVEVPDPLGGRIVVFHTSDLDVSALVRPDPRPKRRKPSQSKPTVTSDDNLLTSVDFSSPPSLPAQSHEETEDVISDDFSSPPSLPAQSHEETEDVISDDWVVFWYEYAGQENGLARSAWLNEIRIIGSIKGPGSESILRTMKAEREVDRALDSPCFPSSPFYYKKTEELEKEAEEMKKELEERRKDSRRQAKEMVKHRSKGSHSS